MSYKTDFSSHFDIVEPILQGSLQVNPQNVTNWTLAAYTENVDITFPKSYFRSTLTPSELTELKEVCAYLYSSVILEKDCPFEAHAINAI